MKHCLLRNGRCNLFVGCTHPMLVSILYEVYLEIRLLPYFYQYRERFNPLRESIKNVMVINSLLFDNLAKYMILFRCEQLWWLHYTNIPEQPENKRSCSQTVGKMLPKTLPSTKGQHLLTSNTRREVTYGTGYHLSLGVSSTFSYFRYCSDARREANCDTRALPRYVQALLQWRKRVEVNPKGSVSRTVNTPFTKYPENLLTFSKDVVHE
jgi:hypothetical protein